jgi:DNA-binding response OmpR family regulator
MAIQLPVVTLAEDDLALLQAWADLLERMGYQVHTFDSGMAALAAPQVDVLLPGYNLGDLPGIALVREARTRRSGLPAAEVPSGTIPRKGDGG